MKIPAGKVLAALGWAVLMTACASIGPPLPPSLELPKPPVDLRAVRKGDRVTLTWTIPKVTTDRRTVRSVGGTRICRGTQPLTQCGTPVGEAAPGLVSTNNPKQKKTDSYTDVLPVQSDDPASFATYAVEVLNTEGRGAGLSNQVRVELVRTLPPPGDFQARVTGQGVVLSWTNELPEAGPAVRYVYRVYRRPEGSEERTLVGEVAAGGERSASLSPIRLLSGRRLTSTARRR